MEKQLDVKISTLTGRKDQSKRELSEVLIFKPADHESLSLRGQLFVVLDVSSAGGVDLKLASKLVLDVIREAYYSDLEGAPLKALEKALLSAKHRLVNLAFGTEGTPSGGEIDFNVVAAVLWGTVIYLAQIESSRAYLLRAGKLSDIGSSEEGAISVASGIVKEDDTIILGSKGFGETLVAEKVVETLSDLRRGSEGRLYPPSFSVIILDFKVRYVPSREEILGLYDVEAVQSKGWLKIKLFLEKSFLKVIGKIRGFKILDKVKETIGEKLLKAPKEIYIQRPEELGVKITPGAPKIFKLAIGFLIILFSVSVFFTISRKRSKSHSIEVVRLLSQAESKLQSAQTHVDLNNARARSYLGEALDALTSAKDLERDNEEVERMFVRVYEIQDKVNKVSRLEQPDLLYDFTIQDKKSAPVSITGSGAALFVADRGVGITFSLKQNENAVNVEKTAVESIGGQKQIVPGANRLFVLTDTGVSYIKLDNGTITEDILSLPEANSAGWENIVSFDIYMDNIYFLNLAGGIYKFVAEENTFSEVSSWLKEGENFEDAVALTVDGDIYVLKRISGEILKFTQGERVDFKLKELDKPLDEPVFLFTTPESNFLYILDKGGKRVVVVVKESGLYQQQFVYSGKEDIWNNLKAFWVDEENTVIYVLDGTRVYRVDY